MNKQVNNPRHWIDHSPSTLCKNAGNIQCFHSCNNTPKDTTTHNHTLLILSFIPGFWQSQKVYSMLHKRRDQVEKELIEAKSNYFLAQHTYQQPQKNWPACGAYLDSKLHVPARLVLFLPLSVWSATEALNARPLIQLGLCQLEHWG
jgi:hypothetical protein